MLKLRMQAYKAILLPFMGVEHEVQGWEIYLDE
jgi:hypothetical protein